MTIRRRCGSRTSPRRGSSGPIIEDSPRAWIPAQVVFKIYSIWVEFGFGGLWGGFWGWEGLGGLSGTLEGVILVV